MVKAQELAIVVGVTTIVAMPFVIPVIIMCLHIPAREPSPLPFNAEKWFSTRQLADRYAMLEDLKKQHKLLGMTEAEVYRLLGKPERELSFDGFVIYRLGAVGDDSVTELHIHFDKGHVDKVEVLRDK